MLRQLFIKNFAIIDQLNLEFEKGLTVVTGETGAGKSIIIDALSLLLGDRADSKAIGGKDDKCEITAEFDILKKSKTLKWLKDNDLEDNEESCTVRRILNTDGRSRNSINGRPVSVQQLRELGETLVHIHSQHQNYALLKTDHQRELLDAFAENTELCEQTALSFRQWQSTQERYQELQQLQSEQAERLRWLEFQLEELTQLGLREGEVEDLNREHKQLTHAEALLQKCQIVQQHLEEQDPSILSQLHTALTYLQQVTSIDEKLQNTVNLLSQARICCEEANTELRHYLDHTHLDPQRLIEVEKRLGQLHDFARKYKVQPQELLGHFQSLSDQRQDLQKIEENLATLEKQMFEALAVYQNHAEKLSQKRLTAAKNLAKKATEHLKPLGLIHGVFSVKLEKLSEPHINGLDKIEFLLTTNPDQPAQPIQKVASGGELSRVALAIQVVCAQTTLTPTFIFDEVDVGIGGGTAAIVGKLLRSLSSKAQILCITHLPQVAAQGHQHLQVAKQVEDGKTRTALQNLIFEQRIEEIARMLGGVKLTQTTLQHAKEMLEEV